MSILFRPQRSRHPRGRLSTLVFALALGLTAGATSAQTALLMLPAPAGPHDVGTLVLRLIDHSRADRACRSGHREPCGSTSARTSPASGHAPTEPLSTRVASESAPETVQVTHDRFLGHVEPDVAVNPHTPGNLLGASQFEWTNHRRIPGTFASFDGGRTWHDNGPLPLPTGYKVGADTTVAFTAGGVGWVAALMWQGGNGAASRVTRGGVFLWRTRDGGRSFSRPIPVYVGQGFQDHPWLAIRNTRQGPVLLTAWTNRAGLELARSRPGSTTFSRPRLLVAGALPSTPVLVLGSHDRLDVFFQEDRMSSGRSKTEPFQTTLAVASSRDDGLTFAPARTIAHVPNTANPADQQPPALLAAAADPHAPVTAVAIAAQDPRRGHPAVELWLRKSPAGPWQGPIFPATGAAARFAQEQPRLGFVDGRLYLSYFTISRAGEIQERLASARERGSSFTAHRLGGPPFTANGFIGDYQALALTSRLGYALWNSDQTGRLEIVEASFPVSH